MSLAVVADTLSDAVDEALALQEMGELDEEGLKRIAYDYGVRPEDIRREIGWEE